MKKIKLTLLSIFVLFSCDNNSFRSDIYPQIYNLKDLNTEFDDYNPVMIKRPFIPRYQNNLFLYSTNYSSKGKNFDIEKGSLFIDSPYEIAVSEIKSSKKESFNIGNSEFNEYGPNIIYLPQNKEGKAIIPNTLNNIDEFNNLFTKKDDEIIGNNLYTFSSDRKNNQQDIYIYTVKNGLQEFFGNDEKYDDKYISYDYEQNIIYFSSNRENGNYNIYKYENKENNLELDKLFIDKKLSNKITAVNEINSIYNDTCPFISGNLMLFASDRPGGKGGYDLYFSIYSSGKWVEPKNLQILIDEYYKKIENDSNGDIIFDSYIKHKNEKPVLRNIQNELKEKNIDFISLHDTFFKS